jgi:hypothetical protein
MTHGSTVDLVLSVFPIFSYTHETIKVRILAFAPHSGEYKFTNPRAVITVAAVANIGKKPWNGSLIAPNIRDVHQVNKANALATPADSPHPHFTEHPVPVRPGYEAVQCLENTAWADECPEVRMELDAGEEKLFSFALLLGESPEELRAAAEFVERHSVLEWLNKTLCHRIERCGRLEIPSDPYYSENYIRLVEQAASSILYNRSGLQYGGGPSGAWDYGMAIFEPAYLEPSLEHLGKGEYISLNPASPRYSLASAAWPLVALAMYYQMTGNRNLFARNPQIMEYARLRLSEILATRKGDLLIFPSKMIWDGPALGDYHTGSNILVWKAFEGMARLAVDVYEDSTLAAEWSGTARKVREDIWRYCKGNGTLSPRFYEGVYEDRTFAPGHDGEEAFTTLAPYFGFCEADEPALINHAKLAFTEENPLYEPAVDGIWWDKRGTYGTGITIPGQMAMLVGINNEKELHARLEQLRRMTDVDGSLWWWPYLYPCSNPRHIRRRDWPTDVSKCGYAAALYMCLFVNNIMGIRADMPAKEVSLRPFCPWKEFTWKNCRIGTMLFDFEYKEEGREMVGRITNKNTETFMCSLELTLPEDVDSILESTEGSAVSSRFQRTSVRVSEVLEPGMSKVLKVVFK